MCASASALMKWRVGGSRFEVEGQQRRGHEAAGLELIEVAQHNLRWTRPQSVGHRDHQHPIGIDHCQIDIVSDE